MNKMVNLEKLKGSGLVAVIRRPNPDDIEFIAEALIKGGVGALEITVDSVNAFEMIESVKNKFGLSTLVGAGTVLDSQTAKTAINAGADFIFSPIYKTDMIQITNRHGVISIPGVLTPTEIVHAYELGADILKIFPASSLGVQYMKDLQGPLGHIPMMPTGGVTVENTYQYIKQGAVAVGAGGALLDKQILEQRNFNQLTERALQFKQEINRARQE